MSSGYVEWSYAAVMIYQKKKSHSEKNSSFVHWDSSGTLTNQGEIKETSILEQLGRLG